MKDRLLLANALGAVLKVDGVDVVTKIAHKGDFSNDKLLAEMRTPIEDINRTRFAMGVTRVLYGVYPEKD